MTDTNISFRQYGMQAIRERLAIMLEHADGVRARDVEALHDMRVASRRLRASLGIFAACFMDPTFSRFEKDVKEVTDALGAARDLDVMIETLEKLELTIPEELRAGVEAFTKEKRENRLKMQKSVDHALDRLVKRDLCRVFDEMASRCEARAAWMAGPIESAIQGSLGLSEPATQEGAS